MCTLTAPRESIEPFQVVNTTPSGRDVCFARLDLSFKLIGHFQAILDQVLQPVSQLLLLPGVNFRTAFSTSASVLIARMLFQPRS